MSRVWNSTRKRLFKFFTATFSKSICAAAFFLCLIPILFVSEAGADEIIMKNGDRLQGKVISMDSGKLVFETPYAGKITVAWDQVERLTSDETLEVTLPDKEVVKGRAVKGEDGVLILQPETGPAAQPVALSKVSSMSPPKPPPSWTWSGNASGGIDYQTGKYGQTAL